MLVIIFFFISLTGNDTQTNIFIAIISLAIFFQVFNVIDYNYQAEVKSKYVVQIQFIQLILTSFTKLFFIFLKAPLLWFVWVYCFDAFLLAIGLVVMYMIKSGNIFLWRWKWEVALDILRDSWPLLLSGMLISIYVKIDQVMIKEILGQRQVGRQAEETSGSRATDGRPQGRTGSRVPASRNAKNTDKDLSLRHSSEPTR